MIKNSPRRFSLDEFSAFEERYLQLQDKVRERLAKRNE